MLSYILTLLTSGAMDLRLADTEPSYSEDPVFELAFSSDNYFDSAVMMAVGLTQTAPIKALDELSLSVLFYDDTNNDGIYFFKGMLSADENEVNSIVAVMDAHGDFSDIELNLFENNLPAGPSDFFDEALASDSAESYNPYATLGKKRQLLTVPTGQPSSVPDIYQTLIRQDDQATVLYYQVGDNLQDYTALVRAAKKMRVRLIVELPPTLTIDQAVAMAEDLTLDEHFVTFIWAPIIARPFDAKKLKGKKVARWCGGTLLGRYVLRQGNKDRNGIPAIHRPIAGHDYPFSYLGIQQNPEIFLDDPDFKRLANAKINMVKRERYPNGIRFILDDSLTTYNDNQSLLKLCNASDISMFIDSRLIDICKRHLQKHMTGFIEDATTECTEFLDNCTSKDRPLLVMSDELGGYYDLSIVPSTDRPHDTFELECGYHTQGTARAGRLKTRISA
ncbi:hypothetical protein [Acinetobacter sp. ANC 3813]|uniref:hypothetical protein n=1 Tax=Acinetobacter sp. ANC 3813 TaxID=1977873 RepID=UPI000A34692C|nr:hypothetical protein [Acinetobacter sp. ANC 3813]OTG87886.1 hypothetical protein B9T34_16250 [Acinetobacter sp. ANC 3813]